MKIFEQEKEYKFYAEIKGSTAKISYIGVKPRFRKEGIARKRVEDFIKLCIKKGVEQIRIDAYKNCLDFWKKMGFQIDNYPQISNGVKQHYHDGLYILSQIGTK